MLNEPQRDVCVGKTGVKLGLALELKFIVTGWIKEALEVQGLRTGLLSVQY